MKTPLAVGNRVRVNGWDSKGGYWENGHSTVVGFSNLGVIVERNGRESSVHAQQCRRLVKKKPLKDGKDCEAISFAIGVLKGVQHCLSLSEQQRDDYKSAESRLRKIVERINVEGE